MGNKKLLYAMAIVYSLGTTAVMAAPNTMMKLECEDLASGFKLAARDKTEMDANKLAKAKDLASQGEKECLTNAERGIIHLKAALYDIGISQHTVKHDMKMKETKKQ